MLLVQTENGRELKREVELAMEQIKGRISLTEKVQAMELLWRSRVNAPEKVKSPAWHKTVLQRRLAQVEVRKGEFLTMAQLKKRLAKRTA